MYISKYFTNEEVDQRLLEGYYDDFVKAGFEGSKEEFFAFVLSIRQCVMKEEGKGLSTNDFTNEYKEKIDSTTTWSARIYRDHYEEGKVIFSVIPDRILIFENPWDLQDLVYDPDLYSTINTVYQSIFILKPINNRDLYNPFPESSFIRSGNKSLVKDQWNYVHIMWCVTEKPDTEDLSTWKGFVNIEILTDPVSNSESVWSAGTGLHSALLLESGSQASGEYSVAEGFKTKSISSAAHAEGSKTVASGPQSHAEGSETTTSGVGAHSEGGYTQAANAFAHAEGCKTVASGDSSHAEGYQSETGGSATSNTKTSGPSSGKGAYAHAEGDSTIAKGKSSHSEGKLTFASGEAAHAEGNLTTASGDNTHSEGLKSSATNTNDHAEGNSTEASGGASHAEGYKSKSKGTASHAEGWNTEASGQASHAEGLFTKTLNQGEHASGRYNFSRAMASVRGGTIFSVGNGTSESGRFNIMELTFADALFLYGLGGYDGKTIDESTESVQDIILVEALSNEEINNLIPELV